jgi:hypothetical protein
LPDGESTAEWLEVVILAPDGNAESGRKKHFRSEPGNTDGTTARFDASNIPPVGTHRPTVRVRGIPAVQNCSRICHRHRTNRRIGTRAGTEIHAAWTVNLAGQRLPSRSRCAND